VEITDVRVFPVDDEKLRAFVSVVLDRCFMVNDIKVIQGKDGLFISMPSRKRRNGDFKDIAHPLNQETRRLFEDRILHEYRVHRGEAVAEPEPHAAETTSAASETADEAPASTGETLEEIERRHLKDSFWSMS